MTIIDDSALTPFRAPGPCSFCRKAVFRREVFHVLAAGAGGGGRLDHPYNVLAVCSAMSGGDDCHARWHSGTLAMNGRKVTTADCFALIATREGVPARDLQDGVVFFRNLDPKQTEAAIQWRLNSMRPGTAEIVKVLLAARVRKPRRKNKGMA